MREREKSDTRDRATVCKRLSTLLSAGTFSETHLLSFEWGASYYLFHSYFLSGTRCVVNRYKSARASSGSVIFIASPWIKKVELATSSSAFSPFLLFLASPVAVCFFLFPPSVVRLRSSLCLSYTLPLYVSSCSSAISRLADELNRAGGPPYFCLAGRVHSPRHCSDCDRTETTWALLLAERTIYRIELARETKEKLRICNCNVAIGRRCFSDSALKTLKTLF